MRPSPASISAKVAAMSDGDLRSSTCAAAVPPAAAMAARDRLELIGNAIDQVNLRALGGEQRRDRPAYAARGAGDDGDLAGQLAAHVATRPPSMRRPIPVVNEDWSEAR